MMRYASLSLVLRSATTATLALGFPTLASFTFTLSQAVVIQVRFPLQGVLLRDFGVLSEILAHWHPDATDFHGFLPLKEGYSLRLLPLKVG